MRYPLLILLSLLLGCRPQITPHNMPNIPYNTNEADKAAFFGTIRVVKDGHLFPFKPLLNTCTALFAPPYEAGKEGAFDTEVIRVKKSLGNDNAHIIYMARQMASNPNSVAADLTKNGFVLQNTTLRTIEIMVHCMERKNVTGFTPPLSERPLVNRMATHLVFDTIPGTATYFGDIIIELSTSNINGDAEKTNRDAKLEITLGDHEKEAQVKYKNAPQMPNSYSMRKSLVKVELPAPPPTKPVLK